MGSLTKGLIGKEDHAIQTDELWPSTFNRTASTGSTVELRKMPDIWKMKTGGINAMYYGDHDLTDSTISTACSAIGATNNRVLYLEPGTWVIDADLDLSSYTNIFFDFAPGAVLSVASSKTLTLPSPGNIIASPNQQIFTGDGAVVFSNPGEAPLEWFGGLPDGSTICNTAISNAIDALTTNGGTIDCGRGTYLINTNVYWESNVNLHIYNNSWLKLADSSGDHIKLIDSSTNQDTYGLVSNVTLWGDSTGGIDGNTAGQSAGDRSHCISGTGTNWTIENLIIKNAGVSAAGSLGNGIIVDASDGIVEIENVVITGCSFTGNERQDIAIVAGQNIRVTNNTFSEDQAVVGVDIEPEGLTGPYGQVYDVEIDNNVFRNGGCNAVTSIDAVMNRINIHDNIFVAGGVRINDAKNITVSNNSFYNGTFTAGYGVIAVKQSGKSTAGNDNIFITNNIIDTFTESGTPNARSGGIQLYGYSNDMENVVVSGNVLRNLTATSGAGILIEKTNRINITNNIIRDSDTNRGISVNTVDDVIVTGNMVEIVNDAWDSYPGLLWLNGCNRTIVSDNLFEYSGTGALPKGVHVRYSDDVRYLETNIVRNTGSGSITNYRTFEDNGVAYEYNWVGAERLLATRNVAFNADADTDLYVVPTGHTLVLTKVIVIAGSDAGATTTISIGQDGAETDFIPANTLSNLDAANDVVIIKPIPNTTPLKNKAYSATTTIQAQVASHSGGATNTVLLFGVLY